MLGPDGRVQARALRLGLRTLQVAEVLSGLQAGEYVLLDERASPGQRARAKPVPPAAPSPALPASAASAAHGR